MQGGIYIFTLLDNYTAIVSLMIIAFFEVVALCWMFGSDRICDEVCEDEEAGHAKADNDLVEDLDEVVDPVRHRQSQIECKHAQYGYICGHDLGHDRLVKEDDGQGKGESPHAEVKCEAQSLSLMVVHVLIKRLVLLLDDILTQASLLSQQKAILEDREEDQV